MRGWQKSFSANDPTILEPRVAAVETTSTDNKTKIGVLENESNLYYKQTDITAASGNFVSFVFDDGYTADYTTILPITQAKGIPLSIAMITSKIGVSQFLTSSQLLELQNVYGWEIMSHTHNHVDVTTLTENDIEYEFAISKKILLDLGLNCENFVYPIGKYNSLAMKLASKYFRSSLSSDGYSNNVPVDNQIPLNTHRVKRAFLDTDTLEQLKARIDNMKNTWVIIYSHSDAMSAANIQKFQDIIDYVKTKPGVEINTVSKVFDKYENKIEINNGQNSGNAFRVGANNHLYVDNVASEYLGMYLGITNSTPLSFFPRYKISIASLTSVDASGIPYGTGIGTLITVRTHEEDAVHYQEFYPYTNDLVARRMWDKTNGVWKSWVTYKPYNGETRRNIFPDFGTISANSSVIFDVDCAGITNSGVITATFQAALPAAIIAQVFPSTADKVKFMLSNVSPSALAVGVRSVIVRQNL